VYLLAIITGVHHLNIASRMANWISNDW